MRGFVQLLRRSTPAIKTNTTIPTAAIHRRFLAGIGSKQGSGDVVNSGPKPLIVTETKPADRKGKDDTVKLEICGDVEGDAAYLIDNPLSFIGACLILFVVCKIPNLATHC